MQINSQRYNNGSQFAVLFLDLDEFKTVNDSLGHPVGDLLLVEAARRLSVPLPPEALLARLGGDEFVVLLPLGLEQSLTDIVQNLLQAFARPILVEHHELSCTVSIGVALFPQDGPDPDILLRHADLAMYAAKAAGRNDVRYYQPSMNADALERLTLERDLRHALEDSAGGLQLYYQPQVDAVSGQCIGCEALVRWYHPERGMMMPDAFISLAERSGLIVPLGQWVLAEACRQYKIWEAEGMPLSISVNLSPVQLGRSTLAASVQLLFASHQIPPGAIEFELTESALMDDSDDNLQRFHALIALGSSFALDDFGTGYSSLSRLKRYPISRLKIDRSFVMNLPGNAEDAAVATATLSLARDLGMDVVAEGVETPEQRDYLVSRGCYVMQGYLFARPLTAADMKAFCRTTMLKHDWVS
ncbi:putative bifunctional diguanylate cyclase/phosphodiesterase [Paludibacterium denitrificans]|uniref:EAL domain-containing protein n=1 Tax=Paludibacterium denitrificans TaxID=2675226 RepID=A0A844G811_9NEIS|nr:bifunctional diguanylate cyclase/phosphodiesterase [Paludibacterium denitrificans]MTD32496.1 EAL domain-containing protein [Paludibacterium denitrificans]